MGTAGNSFDNRDCEGSSLILSKRKRWICEKGISFGNEEYKKVLCRRECAEGG